MSLPLTLAGMQEALERAYGHLEHIMRSRLDALMFLVTAEEEART
jgi:hypothetical protein